MTTLVTGATGFLGGRLVRRYLDRGEPVIAMGRDTTALDSLSTAGAFTLRHDLEHAYEGRMIKDLREVDTIVHCAALSSPFGPKRDFYIANVVGTRNLVTLAQNLGVKRFIQISTPAVYYRPQDQLNVRETNPLPPAINHYADTKRQAETETLASLPEGVVILRPRGIYGPGDTALLPRLLRAVRSGPLPLMNGGKAVTDITHVEDVVDAILSAQAYAGRENEIFNISGGEPVNIKDLIDRVCAQMSQEVVWRPTPVALAMLAARVMAFKSSVLGGRTEPRTTPYSLGLLAHSQTLDISRAQTILGWTPQICFAQGIKDTLTARGHS